MQQPTTEKSAATIKPHIEGAGRSRATIKLILFATLGGMTLLVVATLGWKSAGSWAAYRTAVEQKTFNRDVNRYIAGLYEILLERLATNNALQAAEPVGPVVLATIAAHRARIADSFDPGLAALALWEFPNKPALLQDLQAARQKADDYRRRADAAIKLPRDKRDETLRNTFTPVITDQVNAAFRIWSALLHGVGITDPQLIRLATIKDIGWGMRDYAGRERAIVASAIAAGQPIPAAGLIAIAQHRARVELLWDKLQDLTAAGAHPAIKAAIQGAQEKYFKDFLSLSDAMRKTGEAGAPYPMTPQQWTQTTNPQIDALFEVLFAARTASEDVADAAIDRAYRELALVFALMTLGIVVAIGGMWVVSSRVTRPLAVLAAVVNRLAANNTDVEIPVGGRNDELGAMARSLDVFRNSLIATHWARAEQAESERRQTAEQKTVMMNQLADRFEAAIGNIVNAVTSTSSELATAAATLAQVADDTQQLSTAVAGVSEEASINVRSVASATGQMTSSVGEIAQQVYESSGIADEAVLKAAEANSHFDKLSEAASRVSAVVRFIGEISEQTNLLALNATIEAARAGEAGRGFAVVAGEVKSLATQAAKATEEIGRQIADMQAMTRNSAGAVHDIGATITRISSISSAIAAAVEEQSAVTQQISHNIQQMAHGTAQVAANVGEVRQGADKTSTASNQVLASARLLSDEGKKLRTEVDRFLATVRAA
jgi:methyl-accepting chemotaxis protein